MIRENKFWVLKNPPRRVEGVGAKLQALPFGFYHDTNDAAVPIYWEHMVAGVKRF